MSDFSGRRYGSLLGSRKKSPLRLRRKLQRSIMMETLERRELMAADTFPHHNLIVAEDVNRDFRVQPRDALIVINELNRSGARTLPADFDPKKGGQLLDVNADGRVSPVDALRVINRLNSGEGVGEQVEFKYEILTPQGVSLDPNPNDNVSEFQVGVGQPFILRTSVKDLRANPQSVFAAFHDVNFRNGDGSTGEIAELQWGEYNLVTFGSTVRSGSFTLRYGSETTAPITPVFTQGGSFDKAGTANAIAQAIGDLNVVGGVANVRVRSESLVDRQDLNFFNFGISFQNAKARTNLPNAVVAQNNLRDAADAPISLTLVDNDSPSPTQGVIARTAMNFDALTSTGAQQSPQYNQFTSGTWGNPSAGSFILDEVGGIHFIFSGVDQPGEFKTVFDTLFNAERAGTVFFTGDPSDSDGLEVFLLGETNPVPTDLILFPRDIKLTVVEDIIANGDTYPKAGQPAIREDSATIALDVSANDQLLVGSSFTVDSVTQPAGGSVTIASNGKDVNFRPSANFFGQTSFTYTIKSNLGRTSTATVIVNVTAVNDEPVVIDSTFQIGEDPVTPLVLNPQQIFSAGPLETTQTLTFLSATPVAGQINGTVSLANNQVTYRPTADFFGEGRFVVEVEDSGGLKKSTTVTVTVTPVNDAPIPFTGTLVVNEDTNLRIIGTGAPTDILAGSRPGPANESTQTLRLISVQSPTAQGGTVTTSGGITTYRARANFFGIDTFTYVISDNGSPNESATGTITVDVKPVNDAPNAVDDSGAGRFVVLGFADQFTSLDVMRNDNAGPLEVDDSIKIVAVGTPSRGSTVEILADGSQVRFKPKTGLVNVEETFTYTIEDESGSRDTATATVFIIPPELPFAVEDRPDPIAEDSTNTTNVLTIDVLSNDLVNAASSKRLLRIVTQPANGTARINDNGTPTNLTDDKVEYFANPNVFAPDVFTYEMVDSKAGSKNSIGTVTVTFSEINDSPTLAVISPIAATEDVPKTILSSDLLAGSTKGPNEDAQTLVISSVAAVSAGGSVRLDGGNVVFSPAKDFAGNFQFRFTATDNGTTAGVADPKSATRTVTIQVAAVNDAPIVVSDTQTTAEDTPRTFAINTILDNDKPGPDTAIDEATQTVSLKPFSGEQTTSKGGKIRIVGDNLVYVPATNFNGTGANADTFTYTIVDNGNPAAEGSGVLTLAVTSVNDAPVPVQINREAFANLSRVFDLSKEVDSISPGPADESSQDVTLVRVFANSTTRGKVVLNADGTVTYTAPTDGSTGLDSFSYEVTDNGKSGTANDPKKAIGTVVVDIKPFVPSEIAGVAWIDDNNDGKVGERELKLGGIAVVLTGTQFGQTEPMAPLTYITLADGSYQFDELPPGEYKVKFDVPDLTTPGYDWIRGKADTDNVPNEISVDINAPGDVQASDHNFSVLGVSATYANLLENMAGSLYGKYPGIQNKGFYAVVDSEGKAVWSSKRDAFGGALFGEIVLTDDKSQAILTRVDANQNVYSAVVPRNRLIRVNDAEGNVLLRVLADVSDLNWTTVDLDNPPNFNSRSYLDSVEMVFAQEEW